MESFRSADIISPVMTTILIATRNKHKVEEIRAILGTQYQYLTLNDFPDAPKVVEDADTFAGNALKKAETLAQWLAKTQPASAVIRRGFVLADDSGLEVDALEGAPGVYSARFASLNNSENSSDAANNSHLLELIKNVPIEKRTARFRCVIAWVPVPEAVLHNSSPVCYAPDAGRNTCDGACEGRILDQPIGAGGFGYDPLFVPTGYSQSFGELGEDVKNRLSHRARALEKLRGGLLVGAKK
jgi:XTP/dITP diphosphohydrolase